MVVVVDLAAGFAVVVAVVVTALLPAEQKSQPPHHLWYLHHFAVHHFEHFCVTRFFVGAGVGEGVGGGVGDGVGGGVGSDCVISSAMEHEHANFKRMPQPELRSLRVTVTRRCVALTSVTTTSNQSPYV